MANVFISYPVYRYPEPESNNCLEKMMMDMVQKKHKIALDKPMGGSEIARVRNRSLGRFIRDGSFDWFLTLDSDIVFNEDLLEILLSHNKEVVGGVYRVKSKKIASACTPVQASDIGWREKSIVMNKGVQEMRFLSGGCMLIHMGAIMEMIEKYQELKYYDDYDDSENWALYMPMIIKHNGMNRYLSEDWAFCQRASDIGIKLFADTDIRLGHMMMQALTFPKEKK